MEGGVGWGIGEGGGVGCMKAICLILSSCNNTKVSMCKLEFHLKLKLMSSTNTGFLVPT